MGDSTTPTAERATLGGMSNPTDFMDIEENFFDKDTGHAEYGCPPGSATHKQEAAGQGMTVKGSLGCGG